MHLDLSSAAVTGAVAMLESNKASENSADFEDCDVKNSIFVDSILHQYRCHFPDLSTYKLPENSSINLFALRSDQLIFDSLLWICLTILDGQLTRCSFLNIIQYRFFVHWTVCRLIGNNHHLIVIICLFFSGYDSSNRRGATNEIHYKAAFPISCFDRIESSSWKSSKK